MIYKTLIIASALFGLFWLTRTKDTFAKAIVIGLVTGIALTFFENIVLKSAGLIVSLLAMAAAIVYGIAKNGFTARKRTLIVLPTALVLLFHTFQFENLPGTGLLGYFQLIPVLTFLYIITAQRTTFKNEIGFMTIITVAGLVAFIIQILVHLI